MKRCPIFVSILFFVLLSTINVRAQEQTMSAHDIMKKQYDMDLGFASSLSRGKMILMGGGSQAEREFEFKQLEKTATEGGKSLVRILKPEELAGTGLLSYTNTGKPNDQWVYLPALQKSKRIAGSSKSGSFIGSEFSFEDLTPPQLEDYDYQLLKSEPCGDTSCYVIESHPHDVDSNYSKIILWVRSDNYQNIKMDLYNKAGALFKQASFEDIRQLNGKFWRPFKMVMKNLTNGNETDLVILDYKVQASLKAADFALAALER